MIATILFIFLMGAFFCYLVALRPTHLYAPDQIPEGALGKGLYQEASPGKDIIKEAQELVDSLRSAENVDQKRSIANDINARLQIANEVQTAYELLLIPGYDVSLIHDMLRDIRVEKRVDANRLAYPRNITYTTVETILETMKDRRLVSSKHGEWYLTENGQRLLNSLSDYLNVHNGD